MSATAASIAARCESLGRNCEFGLVQRLLGIETIGLLRWAGAPREALIRGLKTRFAGIGRSMDLEKKHGNEWHGVDHATGIEVHCSTPADQPEAYAKKQEARRLPRLAEKLIEDIKCGEKILVYSSPEFSSPHDAIDILATIRDIGSGPVLIVAQGDEELSGIDYLAWGAALPALTEMNRAGDVDVPGWTRILAQLAEVELGIGFRNAVR